jgi:hypothetical protein
MSKWQCTICCATEQADGNRPKKDCCGVCWGPRVINSNFIPFPYPVLGLRNLKRKAP